MVDDCDNGKDCVCVCRYEPYVNDGDDRDFASHIVTVVTLVSCYQYIILAVVFSKGAPYRLSIFTNCE